MSYAWVFGDGATGTGPTPAHTFATAGTLTAKLTVTDDKGATGSATASIVVTDQTTVNAPSNLTATVSNRTATLNWKDNSGNESGFYIERAGSSGAFSRSATGKTSAYSNTVSVRVR